MAKKSIKRNYIYNLIQQILVLITPLVTAPYVSRVLGADGIGTFSYTSSIVSFFSLFAALGISAYGQREISYAQDNREKRTEIFWNAKCLSLITSLVCIALYFGYVYFFDKKHTVIYLILTINLIAIITDVSWLFQGMEEFGITVTRNIIARILNVAVIFIFVHKKSDLLLYIFSLTFTTFVCNVSLWAFVPKFIGKPKLKNLHPFTNLKVIISLFIPTIAISIYTVLDKTMIGIFTTESFENGYYEQSTKISKMVLSLVTALAAVMVPRIGHHFEKKEFDIVQTLMYKSYRFIWFLGIPLCLGLIGVAPNFVPWFYGADFTKVIPLLAILSLLIPAISLGTITGAQYLVPTKRQNLLTITVSVGAAVNLICNIILIPRWQSIGAALGSVIAEFSVSAMQIWFIRKELSPKKIILSSTKYIVAGAIMFILLIFENKFFTPSVVHTLCMVISGVIVYMLVLLILRDRFLIENIDKVSKKLLKVKGNENNKDESL